MVYSKIHHGAKVQTGTMVSFGIHHVHQGGTWCAFPMRTMVYCTKHIMVRTGTSKACTLSCIGCNSYNVVFWNAPCYIYFGAGLTPISLHKGEHTFDIACWNSEPVHIVMSDKHEDILGRMPYSPAKSKWLLFTKNLEFFTPFVPNPSHLLFFFIFFRFARFSNFASAPRF